MKTSKTESKCTDIEKSNWDSGRKKESKMRKGKSNDMVTQKRKALMVRKNAVEISDNLKFDIYGESSPKAQSESEWESEKSDKTKDSLPSMKRSAIDENKNQLSDNKPK